MPGFALAGLIFAASAGASEFEVSAVGDLYLWRAGMQELREELEKKGMSEDELAAYPFAKVRPHFSGTVFGNLESPVTAAKVSRFKPSWMRWYFTQPPGLTEKTLLSAGFEVLSLANNHCADAGPRGLADTRALLEKAGLKHLGSGASVSEAAQALEFEGAHWLAFNDIGPEGSFAGGGHHGAHRYDRLKARALAGKAGKPLVMSVHWGEEQRRDYPVAEPQPGQRKQARALVEDGVSLFLGHHTHAVSRFEEWKDGLIAYSLGNFLFSVHSDSQRERSVILKASFDEGKLRRWTLVPVWNGPLTSRFQPEVMEEGPGRRYLKALGARGRRYINYYDENGKKKFRRR